MVSICYADEWRDCFPHPARIRPVYQRAIGGGGEWRMDRADE